MPSSFPPTPPPSAVPPPELDPRPDLLERLLDQRVAARTAALEAANQELRAEAARRETAERALAAADAQLSRLTDDDARQWGLAGLVGGCERFGQLLREIRAVQGSARTSVLLVGESGTGKELAARSIHYGGAQAGGPFVRVDCASLPGDLAQAEAFLFGTARAPGSRGEPPRRGQCELAEGGTLFFDEIGDLDPLLQARLLRVLEDGAYRPVGSEQPRDLNARIIAATHADLPTRIAEGRFRQDLYYRLGRYPIAVPALRERMEDLPALAQYLVRRLASELKRPAPRLRPEALQRLLAHAYPGNIRELRNTLERAMLYAGGDELGAEHILFAPGGPPCPPAPASASPAPLAENLSGKFLSELPLNLSEAEDILIARAIAVAEGNLSRAARLLGINRASLYRWQARRAAAASPRAL
jgi:DNA-binding NtrC family response regulator